MSGLLILFAVSLLFDEPLPAPVPIDSRPAIKHESVQSETLPAPRAMASTVKSTKLISSNSQLAPAPTGADDAKVGWGIDSADGTMYMVIQIAPSAIETFAAGQRGQELASRIPPMLRNRIEKVIIRFGTGPVEQVPPESELVSMPLPRNSSPHIANLDMRSTVGIDAPRSGEAVLTASTTQIPIVPNNVLPSTTSVPNNNSLGMAPRGIPSSNEVFPSNTPPPYGGTSPLTSPSVSSTPAWNNNTSSTRTPTTTANDGFAPLGSTVPTTLNPFGSPRTSAPYPNTTPSNGNVTYSGTNTSGNNYGNNAFGNPPMVAANPNAGIYPPGNNPVLPPNYPGTLTNNNPNPPYAQNQTYPPNGNNALGSNYGLPVSTNPATYASGGYAPGGSNPIQGPLLPPPLNAGRDLRSTGGSLAGQTQGRNLGDERLDNRELFGSNRPGSLVPFFLVLSFILNVYFGLWLNHLRTKYRHLLGTARGISPLEMDRA